MISNPNLIFYTCIATGTTILAEFNTRDADMATLALQCLEKTPNHHTSFTHTVHGRSHTFFIDPPFVYFAIYDQRLEYPVAISYLKCVRDAFGTIHLNSDKFQSLNFTSHCFQGEFNPVFHQLLASNVDFETPASSRGRESGKLSGVLSPNSLTRKKKRLSSGDAREGLIENNVDFSDRDLSLSVRRNGGLYENSSSGGLYENSSSGGLYENSYSGGCFRAKKVWKRHVWVILTLDLVVCLILIGVWLFICKGFKCIDI